MIDDDDVGAERVGRLDRLDAAGSAAVDSDDQPGSVLPRALRWPRRSGRSPRRYGRGCRSRAIATVGAQEAWIRRSGRRAIDVVVAEDRDGFDERMARAKPLCRPCHVLQLSRVRQEMPQRRDRGSWGIVGVGAARGK